MPPGIHTAEEDRGWFAARLRDGDHDVWVAEDADGLLLGYALLTATWLDHLFVEPERQSSGVGGALLDVVKGLRPDGFCLWVFESNVPARTFYARRGLVEILQDLPADLPALGGRGPVRELAGDRGEVGAVGRDRHGA